MVSKNLSGHIREWGETNKAGLRAMKALQALIESLPPDVKNIPTFNMFTVTLMGKGSSFKVLDFKFFGANDGWGVHVYNPQYPIASLQSARGVIPSLVVAYHLGHRDIFHSLNFNPRDGIRRNKFYKQIRSPPEYITGTITLYKRKSTNAANGTGALRFLKNFLAFYKVTGSRTQVDVSADGGHVWAFEADGGIDLMGRFHIHNRMPAKTGVDPVAVISKAVPPSAIRSIKTPSSLEGFKVFNSQPRLLEYVGLLRAVEKPLKYWAAPIKWHPSKQRVANMMTEDNDWVHMMYRQGGSVYKHLRNKWNNNVRASKRARPS